MRLTFSYTVGTLTPCMPCAGRLPPHLMRRRYGQVRPSRASLRPRLRDREPMGSDNAKSVFEKGIPARFEA